MTNRMKLIFVIAVIVSTAFAVLSTPFAVDIADQILSVAANALGLHEAPILSALAVLVIPGLYRVSRQRRRS